MPSRTCPLFNTQECTDSTHTTIQHYYSQQSSPHTITLQTNLNSAAYNSTANYITVDHITCKQIIPHYTAETCKISHFSQLNYTTAHVTSSRSLCLCRLPLPGRISTNSEYYFLIFSQLDPP